MGDVRLMKGNEALAEAAIRAGCHAYFGYPITPQSEVLEYLADEGRKRGMIVLQAESEVASINMVYGACRCRRARHDLLFQSGRQPDDGRDLLYRLRRTPVSRS